MTEQKQGNTLESITGSQPLPSTSLSEHLIPLLQYSTRYIEEVSKPEQGLSFYERSSQPSTEDTLPLGAFKELTDEEIAAFDTGKYDKRIEIDNGGFVQLVDFMGNDLSIVRAARASYNKAVGSELTPRDESLLAYLWKHQHTSPFRHASVSFIVRCPIFVLRQWQKHQIGCSWSFELNEQSGRYVKLEHGNFRPKEWRYQDTKNKQSSFGELPPEQAKRAYALLDLAYFVQDYVYSELTEMGVAREQARIHNAVGQYTQCMWTGSLQAVMHFLTLRNKPEAQRETKAYAEGIRLLTLGQFPRSLELIGQAIEYAADNNLIGTRL